MEDNLFAYLQRLELLAFFSGFPLLYALTLLIVGNKRKRTVLKSKMIAMLPYAYALIGTLYLGLQLKNLYLNYSTGHLELAILQPYLMAWALLSLLFWIPALGKNKELALIHSLVFFFFLIKDFIPQISGIRHADDLLKNDMRIYFISFLLNLGALILMMVFSQLFFQKSRIAGHKK